VIFQENVSVDHYFGTYPQADNPKGEPVFQARPGTPGVNGLTDGLFDHNPNAANPFRLDRAHNYTCDQNHDYLPEQQATNAGLLDEQRFLVDTINKLQTRPEWAHMAVIIAWDDSDGW